MALMLFLPFCLYAQEITPNTIIIDAGTSVTVPADLIIFTITLTSESDSAQQAYMNHRRQEKNLLKIIEQYRIPDVNISYSLLDIRKQYNRDGKIVYFTSQSVTITLSDISRYYDFQLSLLTNGLEQFGSRFSVKDDATLVEKGYDQALKLACIEAGLLAEKAGKKIGDVIAILSRSHSNEVYDFGAAPMRMEKSSLLDLPQEVSRNFNLTVMFELIP